MVKSNDRIYLSPPHMSGKELEYVKEAFESNWIAPLGLFVDRFETDFAQYHGGGYAAAVSSGTSALHLLLRILNIGSGDKVFCSSWTFCGSVNPIIYQGAQPVFIDSDRISWNMDPNLLETALREADQSHELPKALIIVHLYGQSADMDAILEICGKYDIPVIEDAAEALGAQYKNRPAGTSAWASIFSFNGNKIITTSGGGMVWSEDEAVIEKVRFLATQARDPAPYYEHTEIGYNYRMSNLLAAVGVGQLEVLDERVKQARNIYSQYENLLNDLPGIDFMPEPAWSFSTRWLTCITINPDLFGADYESLRQILENHNVESRPLWKPMHLQPVFRKYKMCVTGVSEALFMHGLCLPSGTSMSDKDVMFVCDCIKKRLLKIEND